MSSPRVSPAPAPRGSVVDHKADDPPRDVASGCSNSLPSGSWFSKAALFSMVWFAHLQEQLVAAAPAQLQPRDELPERYMSMGLGHLAHRGADDADAPVMDDACDPAADPQQVMAKIAAPPADAPPPAPASLDAPQAPPLSPELAVLRMVTQALRASGFSKILICEQHDSLRNLETIGAVLNGAIALGEPVGFYRELNIAGANMPRVEHGVQDGLRSDNNGLRQQMMARLETFVTWASNTTPNISIDPVASNEFRSALASGQVTPYFLVFQKMSGMGLQRFLDANDFVVGSMGISHCLARISEEEPNHWALFGSRFEVSASRRSPPLSKQEQRDMYNAFNRSHRLHKPSVVVLNNEIWKSVQRDLFFKSMRDRFVFMEVPLTDGGNATIFTIGKFLPVFLQIAADHPGEVHLICDGWDGCPNDAVAPALHDEV